MRTEIIFLLILFKCFATEIRSVQGSNSTSIQAPPPIDINSKTAKFVPTIPIAFIGNGGFEPIRLVNTGTSVEAYPDPPFTSQLLAGSILKGIYIYYKTVFTFSNSSNGIAGTTVNQKNGTPLEILIIYYNMKHGSVEKASKEEDGLLVFRVRVQVNGLIPNPGFDIFAAELRKIKQPGASIPTALITVYGWFDIFPYFTFFYIYRESNYIVVAPFLNPLQRITPKQFEVFKELCGYDGKPLATQSTPLPQPSKKILLSVGVAKIPFFIELPTNR